MKVTKFSILSIKSLKIHVIPELARAEIAIVPSNGIAGPTAGDPHVINDVQCTGPGCEGGFQRRGDDDGQNLAPKGPPRHQQPSSCRSHTASTT
jgi:hypothetical protein